MENSTGVQDSGSLRIGFDAEFQDLCVHRVVIHRDGKTIDRLNPQQVRIIQPEPGLWGHMITGRQTAVLFVEDLRVGDVLEYAYTIRGANPVLKGHYASSFTIQSGSPVDRELFRVVWEDKAPLYQRLHLTSLKPLVQPWQEGLEYSWAFTNLAAIPYEDCQPASFEPYPRVEVSDFADWQSVANWALPLYGVAPTNVPLELQELIKQWSNQYPSGEGRARLALQFVQDDLRYTGIELGPDSYRPADPLETFQKRFGDCKGKVALLRFILQQMGIESCPALVNSYAQEAIADRLPSPYAFNHVILRLELDGKAVWVDPTCSHQGGLLWTRYLPPYGKALLVREGSDALVDVPRGRPESSSRQSTVSTFVVKKYDAPASLTIRTEYRGASADDMREQIADTEINDLAKNYLNYYLRLYPGISGSQPLKIHDDRLANNLIAVEESYTITNLWKREGDDYLRKASFYADNLYHSLTDPNTRLRKTPLAQGYPRIRQHDVIVQLPDKDWQIPDVTTNVEHEGFSFNYRRHFDGTKVLFHYELSSKLPVIPVELVPSFLAKAEHMGDLLADTLQRPDEHVSTNFNWLMVVVAVFGLVATSLGCIWYWRQATATPPALPEHSQLQGLGGWLILVCIGLCLAPPLRIFFIASHWQSYFSAQVWQAVAMPQGGSYHPLYGPLLIFELLGNILLIGLNVLSLGLFFTKRRAFPNVYIIFILGRAVFLAMDDLGTGFIPSESHASGKGHQAVFRAVFYAIIWSLYMVKSKRVKATFIR